MIHVTYYDLQLRCVVLEHTTTQALTDAVVYLQQTPCTRRVKLAVLPQAAARLVKSSCSTVMQNG